MLKRLIDAYTEYAWICAGMSPRERRKSPISAGPGESADEGLPEPQAAGGPCSFTERASISSFEETDWS